MAEYHQGETLRSFLKSTDYQMGVIAETLGMSRQNLNHHLRKPVLDRQFLRDIFQKLKIDFQHLFNFDKKVLVDSGIVKSEELTQAMKNTLVINPQWRAAGTPPKYVPRKLLAQMGGLDENDYQLSTSEAVELLKALVATNTVEEMYARFNELSAIPQGAIAPPHQDTFIYRNEIAGNMVIVPFIDVVSFETYAQTPEKRIFLEGCPRHTLPPSIDPAGAVWSYWPIRAGAISGIDPGDVILTSRVHPDDWATLRNYHTYVIVTANSVWIRDVFMLTSDEIFLLDTDKNKTPITIPFSQITELWIMRRHIRTRPPQKDSYDISTIIQLLEAQK